MQSPEQIKEILEEGIGMEHSEFVCSLLTKLCEADRDLGNHDLKNYTFIIIEFPAVTTDLLKHLLHAIGTDGAFTFATESYLPAVQVLHRRFSPIPLQFDDDLACPLYGHAIKWEEQVG